MRSALMAYRTSRKVHKIMDSVLGSADCRHSHRASNYLRTFKCTMPAPAAVRLLRSWVRIQPGAWMSVCCECCVSSGRSPCDELITRPEESYRLWCVVECDVETECMRRVWPMGAVAPNEKKCTTPKMSVSITSTTTTTTTTTTTNTAIIMSIQF